MSFLPASITDVLERAVTTGAQYWIGATGGVVAVPDHPLLGGIVGAVLASLAKSAVGLYYTGAPSLVKQAVAVAEDVVKDPEAKPLIDEAKVVVHNFNVNPEVAKVEEAVAPVVAAVQNAVANAGAPPT